MSKKLWRSMTSSCTWEREISEAVWIELDIRGRSPNDMPGNLLSILMNSYFLWENFYFVDSIIGCYVLLFY